MRLITLALTALLILIQYPLWLGKGGWLRAWDLDQHVIAAQRKNDELKARNAKLESEVQDLKDGTGAIEERAIKVGIETPAQVEVLSGVARDELVIVGNRSQLRAGQKVETKLGGIS